MADIPGMAIVRSAIENAWAGPVPDDAGILDILAGAAADGALLRAVFADVSLQTLAAVTAAGGVGHAAWLAAYRYAREAAGAVNPEVDRLIAEPW